MVHSNWLTMVKLWQIKKSWFLFVTVRSLFFFFFFFRWENTILLKQVWRVPSLVSKKHNRLSLRNCNFHGKSCFFFVTLCTGHFLTNMILSLLNILLTQLQFSLFLLFSRFSIMLFYFFFQKKCMKTIQKSPYLI